MAFEELKSCLFQHLVPDGYAPTQDILAGQAGLEPAAHGLTVESNHCC